MSSTKGTALTAKMPFKYRTPTIDLKVDKVVSQRVNC